MKLTNIKLVFLLLALFLLLNESDGIAQVKKKKAQPKRGKSAEEWAAEPNSNFYKLVTVLPEIDKVELYFYSSKELLFSFDEELPKMVKQFGMPVNVISSKTLTNTSAKSFALTWRKLMRGSGGGCLSPAYRVRFYANDKAILESDICFHCHNLTLKTVEKEKGNGEIWGFNAGGTSGQEFLKKLKELLPEK